MEREKNNLAKIETEMWESKDEEEGVEFEFKHARCWKINEEEEDDDFDD